MSKLTNYLGEPVEYKLGEKTLKFKPFTVRDIFTQHAWAEKKCIEGSKEIIQSLPKEEQSKYTSDLVRYGVDEMTIALKANSPEGNLYLLWLSASKYQKNMDFASFCDMIPLGQDLSDLIARLQGEEKAEEALVPPVQKTAEQPSDQPATG